MSMKAVYSRFLFSSVLGDRPPPATETKLGPSDPWTDAPELEAPWSLNKIRSICNGCIRGLKLRREGVLLSDIRNQSCGGGRTSFKNTWNEGLDNGR